MNYCLYTERQHAQRQHAAQRWSSNAPPKSCRPDTSADVGGGGEDPVAAAGVT